MFDTDQLGDEDKMKDTILEALIAKMEDVIGSGRLAPPAPAEDKGLAVQVQAPDKESLQEGLDKAGDVLNKVPGDLAAGGDEDDNKTDDERLAELLDGSSPEDDEDEKNKFRS